MNKLFILIVCLLCMQLSSFANSNEEAIAFFNKYVNAANTYDSSITTMYSPSAKIIRQVIKPDGTTVDVATDTATYIRQMKLGQAGAKLKKYKNTYTNITSTPVSNGFKVSSLRQPSGETYKLKAYMILQKQPNGEWLIVEELMQTKEQIFLKYSKR